MRSESRLCLSPINCDYLLCTIEEVLQLTGTSQTLHLQEPSNASLSPGSLPPLSDSPPDPMYSTRTDPTAMIPLLTHAHPTCGYHSVTTHQSPPRRFLGSLSLNSQNVARARKRATCKASTRVLRAFGEFFLEAADSLLLRRRRIWYTKAASVASVESGIAM
jgi:hypothetical protein